MAKRYSSHFGSRKKKKGKPIEIKNEDFLPTRQEFSANKQALDLKRGKEKDVTFFDESIKKSISDTGLRFINYISDSNQEDKVLTIDRFSRDLSLIKEEINPVDYDKRALSILSLYLEDKLVEVKGIMKSDIKTSLGQQDGIRVYWHLNPQSDELVIICIDPHHLVIPSTHKGKDKNSMMYDTFDATLNSKRHCISRYFN